MLEKIRRHWQALTITILLLLVLSPSPIAQPLLHPLQTAQANLKAGNLEIAIEQLEYAMKFEKALAGLHLKVAELALDIDDLNSNLPEGILIKSFLLSIFFRISFLFIVKGFVIRGGLTISST